MAEYSTSQTPAGVGVPASRYVGAALLRETLIATIAFLTVVDLFATQAILPSLARHYQVGPAAMGFAVNASTIGMAVSGLLVAMFSRRIDRRRGIIASLVLLAIPTALLAVAPGLPTFTALRIVQGIFMASAFTLTLAYLGDEYRANAAAGAFAAYITGNVASNLIGRLVSAALADHLGLAANFHVFALLNLAGAVLVMLTLHRMPQMRTPAPQTAALTTHLRDASLRAAFGIGFCILFAFIGTFTFVNFALIRAPLFLSPMQLGFVYLVFLPSVLTTPLAGLAVQRFGLKPALWSGLGAAGLGIPLLASSNLTAVLAGMVLMGVGTFFAQATATGYVGRTAMADRGSASGLYLAAYFSGGIVGSAVLGQVFDRLGWNACLAGIALALASGALLASRLRG
jgi:YNFM family putative membrane transporter